MPRNMQRIELWPTTCGHKQFYQCSTGWNICCDCLFGDLMLLHDLNVDLDISPLLFGLAGHWTSPSRQTLRAAPTVALVPRHPRFFYPLEVTSRSTSHSTSRSVRRRERRRDQRSGFRDTNSVREYERHPQWPGGRWEQVSTIPRISPAGVSPSVAQLLQRAARGRGTRARMPSRGLTQHISGPVPSGSIITRASMSEGALASIRAGSQQRGRGSGIASYRIREYRAPTHAPQTAEASHSSTVVAATPTGGSWSVVASARPRRAIAPPAVQGGSYTPTLTNRSTSSYHASPVTGSAAMIAALERTWAVVPPTPTVIDDWTEHAASTHSSLAETAGRASRLLDAFARATPDVGAITAVQRSQLTGALTALLSITREVRVHAALANETLEHLPVADDVELRPDSACIVCYTRLAEIVLLPCSHLTLCEVWISPRCWWWVPTDVQEQVCSDELQTRAARNVMLCPVCRAGVASKTKVYRS
ncbi:hypothetical protein Q9L58_009263 [Maublancomyces gigas]|uniref:RING-type domain-containing protein n=1 Tax=Discina gigas TaxID=1032678 RepID=A0ABR3G7N5_9PEZI